MPQRLDTSRDVVDFSSRSPLGGADDETLRRVRRMLDKVRRDQWEAVTEFSMEYDDCSPRSEPVPLSDCKEAFEQLPEQQRDALRMARDRIRRYQEAFLDRSRVISDVEGGILGELVRPMESVGCYIPGGRVPLPSTVLMTAYVAKVAGVDEIVICSPPRGEDARPHPVIMAAASLVQEADLYGVGGVQAIGAMTYGAGMIPEVDIITGPGNLFVTIAKKEVFGEVEVDLLAGPSEIAIIASLPAARSSYISADLLSQAEHDPQSRAYLLTPDGPLVDQVEQTLEQMVSDHPKSDRVRLALEESALIQTVDLEEAVELSNELAPEHLELHVSNPEGISRYCENAGAIFLGPHSPEPIGDYVAGSSHTLPTGGSARFFSPLSVRTFRKRQSMIGLSQDGFESIRWAGEELARMESLPGHEQSLSIRS